MTNLTPEQYRRLQAEVIAKERGLHCRTFVTEVCGYFVPSTITITVPNDLGRVFSVQFLPNADPLRFVVRGAD